MLVLDETNKDIAREYEVSFEGENVKYAREKLKNLLAHPIIMSSEIKKGVPTDIVETVTRLERLDYSLDDKRIIETQIGNIRRISDYVKIADVKRQIIKYEFLFTINFISRNLLNIQDIIETFGNVPAEFVRFLLESYKYSNFNNLSSLLNCSSYSYEKLSSLIDRNLTEILMNPEIELFKQVFSHVTLTEISGRMAPFSIREESSNSWRYEEADRIVIENCVNTAKSNEIVVRTLDLKPYKNINML